MMFRRTAQKQEAHHGYYDCRYKHTDDGKRQDAFLAAHRIGLLCGRRLIG